MNMIEQVQGGQDLHNYLSTIMSGISRFGCRLVINRTGTGAGETIGREESLMPRAHIVSSD
jgi:hypothetical protein